MSRPLKVVALLVATVVALFVIAAIALVLFFDPNDYREEIAQAVGDSSRQLAAAQYDRSFYPEGALRQLAAERHVRVTGRAVDPDAPESVHMVAWPEADPAWKNDELTRTA